MQSWLNMMTLTLNRLPLPLLRAVGLVLGDLLYVTVSRRRRVIQTNLGLCFPHWSALQRRRVARQAFRYFAMSWLDRCWLWHSSESVLRQRLTLDDPHGVLKEAVPTVLFAPHFVGLDAGWTRLALEPGLRLATIYARQSNPALDQWVNRGRQRWGRVQLWARNAVGQGLIHAIRNGEWLYLLPDMNFGPKETMFVPFFGIATATVPSLARFARLGQARVVPVLTRLTDSGYQICILPPWVNYPSADLQADTAQMNRYLETWIETMPAQYYWVHRRFKTRPPGEPSLYP